MRWPTTCKTKPTGHRPKSVQPLRRERTAAAAAPRGVGILKDEALPHQRLLVLQRSAVQVQETLGVNKNPGTEFFEHFIAVAGLRIQAHRVGKPRAPAALHSDA